MVCSLFVHRQFHIHCNVFVLSLYAPHLFLFRCLGKDALRDCGFSLVCLLIFLRCYYSFQNSSSLDALYL